jgi:hypothetical protein
MSQLSRRSLVAGAAVLPLSAVPAVPAPWTIPTPWRGHVSPPLDRAAIVVRAEYIVGVLSECFVCQGWHESFDRERAALFLENMRTFDFADGDDPRFHDVLEWTFDHGQSLDWLFQGSPGGMIARSAADAAALAGIQAADASQALIARLAAELATARERHAAVCEAVAAAEAAMFKWKEQNPTPELRWIEGEDDVDGASQKYKAARSAWERKRHTAEAECGYDATHTAESAVCNEIERLTDAVANTPPHSLRAIKIKAAVALQPDYGLDADLAWSIVEDIDRLLTA